MFERFTVAARETVIQAQREAIELGHPSIGTEHLLLALLSRPPGPERDIGAAVLHDAGLDGPRVRVEVRRLVGTTTKSLTEDDAAALQTIGIDLGAVLAKIEASFGPDALEPPAAPPKRGFLHRRWPSAHRPFSPRAKKVLELSLREAVRVKDRHIGSEHLLLGLLREGEGLAAKVLLEAGLNLDDLRRATLRAMGHGE